MSKIGYKWIFNNGFTIQLGTGIGQTWNVKNGHLSYFEFILHSDGRLDLPNFDYHILDFKIGFSF